MGLLALQRQGNAHNALQLATALGLGSLSHHAVTQFNTRDMDAVRRRDGQLTLGIVYAQVGGFQFERTLGLLSHDSVGFLSGNLHGGCLDSARKQSVEVGVLVNGPRRIKGPNRDVNARVLLSVAKTHEGKGRATGLPSVISFTHFKKRRLRVLHCFQDPRFGVKFQAETISGFI